jgi:hypothetical protein
MCLIVVSWFWEPFVSFVLGVSCTVRFTPMKVPSTVVRFASTAPSSPLTTFLYFLMFRPQEIQWIVGSGVLAVVNSGG